MKGTLYGSLTSPYVRLCRLVRARSGADNAVAFEIAAPMDEAIRTKNPLGRVPALLLDNGTACLETTLICRTLMTIGGTDLLPQEQEARVQEEADVALGMGLLELGVAWFLESRRDAEEQSPTWQARRLRGIELSLPMLEAAGRRAAERPEGLAALAVVCVADWLSFRLGDVVDWRGACPAAAATVDRLLAVSDIAESDPRKA